MNDGSERRRIQVDRLLLECCDQKLLHGGSSAALSKAQEALDVATKAPALPSPWPQIAAYRVAHLMLRAEHSQHNLDQIEQLFARASSIGASMRRSPLGPLPDIYRLSVLQRMLADDESSEGRANLRVQIRQTFDHARQEVQRRLALRDVTAEIAQAPLGRGPIQEGLFNLLELAAYFLGQDYSPLEGVGALDIPGHIHGSAWFIVGPDPATARVKLSQELAVEELESRGEGCPKAVLLRLPPDLDRAAWRLATSSEWRDVNPKWIKLLVAILKEASPSRDRLVDLLVSDESGDSKMSLRKLIERTNKGLQSLTGRDDLIAIEQESDPRRLSDALTIFGAVHEPTYRQVPRA